MDLQEKLPEICNTNNCIGKVLLRTYYSCSAKVEEENIFFNLRALVTPPNTKFYNINRYLSLGEIVECIYGESTGEYAGKFSALRVWKLEGGLKNMDRILPLNNRVLCGSARIVYRIREIGVLDVRDDDDLNEDYNDQECTDFVYFNLKDLCFSPEDGDQLLCNRYIHFVSCRASEGSDNDFSWNAIRMWKANSRVNQVEHNSNNLFYAKVEVESVNTVGAVLIHKGSKIAMVWTELQLPCTTMEFYEVEKGDLMWCLVSKAFTTAERDNSDAAIHDADDDVGDQWIVRKILDTFTHETDDQHPLPKFYKNNYKVLPCQSSNELLEHEFLKEFRLQSEAGGCNSLQQIKSKKKLTCMNNQPQLVKYMRYNYQAETLDLIRSSLQARDIGQSNEAGGVSVVKSSIAAAIRQNSFCSSCGARDRDANELAKDFDLVNCVGTVAAITPYGGKIEYSDEPSIGIQFGAHTFYCDGVPIAHTSFQSGTKVHFNARKVENQYQAVHVWIGAAPDLN